MATKKPSVYGIDIGTEGYTISRALPNGTIDLLVNDLSSRKTPLAVSYQSNRRRIGHGALDAASTNPKNTILEVLEATIGKQSFVPSVVSRVSIVDEHADSTVASNDNDVLFQVQDPRASDGSLALSATQILATVMAEAFAFMLSTADADRNVLVSVVAPDSHAHRTAVFTNACLIARKILAQEDRISVFVDSSAAAACAAYRFRHKLAGKHTHVGAKADAAQEQDKAADTPQDGEAAADKEEAASKVIVLLDVGVSTTQVTVLRVAEDGSSAQLSSATLIKGCTTLDESLFALMASRLQDKHKVGVAPGSKSGQRLLAACGKARKVLSANNSTDIVLEVFGEHEGDYVLPVTRSDLEEANAAFGAELAALVKTCLEEAGVAGDDVEAVELIGNGTCIPLVQAAAESAVGAGKLSTTLDRASAIALGAARLALSRMDADTPPVAGGLSEEQLDKAVALEQSLAAQDQAISQIEDARNDLESYILGTRTLADGRNGDKINREASNKLLDEAEDWLYSEEAEGAESPTLLTTYLEDLKKKIEEENQEYYAAVRAEEEAKAAQAELDKATWDAEAATQDKDDHDFRKLKKADRMKLVLRNKDEATELFKDGNYAFAAKHYNKALAHCAKFVDLADDDKAEVSKTEATLHLNLAMCHLKESAWNKALLACDESIAIDKSNPKAYYRKALALENMKDFKLALHAANQGLELAPEDKAMAKLKARIEAKKAKKIEAEKKAYGKMFG